MAEVIKKKCDVYGTVKDVKTHIVTIHEVEEYQKTILWGRRHLSPRALTGLKRAIKRALRPSKRPDAEPQNPDGDQACI